jgi:hypothetical protein
MVERPRRSGINKTSGFQNGSFVLGVDSDAVWSWRLFRTVDSAPHSFSGFDSDSFFGELKGDLQRHPDEKHYKTCDSSLKRIPESKKPLLKIKTD